MKKATTFLAALLACAGAFAAQGRDYSTPPPPGAPRPLRLPAASVTKLPNGLEVQVIEDRRVPLVTVRLAVRAGDAEDPEGRVGTAEAVAGLMTEGAGRLSSAEIARRVASLGGSIAASASSDSSSLSGSVTSQNFGPYFEIFSSVALAPDFPEREIEIYRANALQHLALARSNPGFLASERLSALLFGAHPYGRSASDASLKAISRDGLREFYGRYWSPRGAILFLYGDVSASEATALARRRFEGWKGGPPADEKFPAPPERPGRQLAVVERPGSVQARIEIGSIAPTPKSPYYFPLLLANNVYGGGGGSRLFRDVREKLGYTYDPGSSFTVRRQYGEVVASATVRNAVAGNTLKAFFDVSEALVGKEPPTRVELDRAKNYINGVFALRFATQGGVVGQLANVFLLDLPADWLEKYRARVSAVDAADVESATRKYLAIPNPVVVVVGDPESLRPALAPFGQPEIYDTEGRRRKKKDH
jgi:zinc protease